MCPKCSGIMVYLDWDYKIPHVLKWKCDSCGFTETRPYSIEVNTMLFAPEYRTYLHPFEPDITFPEQCSKCLSLKVKG